jgi:hypothetical protein
MHNSIFYFEFTTILCMFTSISEYFKTVRIQSVGVNQKILSKQGHKCIMGILW